MITVNTKNLKMREAIASLRQALEKTDAIEAREHEEDAWMHDVCLEGHRLCGKWPAGYRESLQRNAEQNRDFSHLKSLIGDACTTLYDGLIERGA